ADVADLGSVGARVLAGDHRGIADRVPQDDDVVARGVRFSRRGPGCERGTGQAQRPDDERRGEMTMTQQRDDLPDVPLGSGYGCGPGRSIGHGAPIWSPVALVIGVPR